MAAVLELRELARGIHPTVLTEEGLRPAVAGLARRAAVPVDLDVRCGRLEAGVEAAAYYFVAEALTNVTRHARASGATVSISRKNKHLTVEVSDDGGGGADPARGSGLHGLADRLDALSGRLDTASPPGRGTRLRAEIPVPVIVADDSAFIRAGVVRILASAGMDVVAEARTADELLKAVADHRPELSVVDIRMPPRDTAGLHAAVQIRDQYRGAVRVLVLSQYLEPDYALRLLGAGVGGVGYLLKDRVAEGGDLVEAAQRVGAGGTAIDPAVVEELVRARRRHDRLVRLTSRERRVLALVAEGRSNRAIADRLGCARSRRSKA